MNDWGIQIIVTLGALALGLTVGYFLGHWHAAKVTDVKGMRHRRMKAYADGLHDGVELTINKLKRGDFKEEAR